MSVEQNKQIVRRFVQEHLNTGKLAEGAQYFAPDFVEHAAPPGMPPGYEGVKVFFTMLRNAFPDFHYELDDTVAESDLVVQRTTGHGTMKGEFLGMPPTGKHAAWSEIHTARLKDGKIVEHWASVDQLGMLQQLGLAPMPGGR